MTEKYDGIRAIWTGSAFTLKKNPALHNHVLLTPPTWMKTLLPSDTFLDGELWCGRQSFAKLNSILAQKTIPENDWQHIKYMIFDTTDPSYNEKPYMERFLAVSNKLKELASNAPCDRPQNVELTVPHKCLDIHHMNSFFESVISSGGEGIVLRDPQLPYKPSYKMWKRKVGK